MFNKAILIGRMVADAEMSTTPKGVNVARFRIAVNRPKQKGKDSKADFINVVVWRHNAEFVKTYFGKGKAIGVEGAIQTGDYTYKDGNRRYTFEVVADRVFFVESKGNSSPQSAAQTAPLETPSGAYEDGFTAIDIDGDEDTPF